MAPTTRNRVASEAIRTAYSNIFGISLDSYLESRIHRILTYNEINLPLDFIMLSEAEIPEFRATKSDEDCTIPRIGITCRSRDETSSKKIVQSDGRSTIKKLYSRPDGPIIIIQSNT